MAVFSIFLYISFLLLLLYYEYNSSRIPFHSCVNSNNIQHGDGSNLA